MIIGLKILLEMKARNINVHRDSLLVLKRVNREYKYHSLTLTYIFAVMVQLLDKFHQVLLTYVPKENNGKEN